ncbi:MAG: hypothetical protein WCE52_07300, partial [Candidatus Acidiferrum sp.]
TRPTDLHNGPRRTGSETDQQGHTGKTLFTHQTYFYAFPVRHDAQERKQSRIDKVSGLDGFAEFG